MTEHFAKRVLDTQAKGTEQHATSLAYPFLTQDMICELIAQDDRRRRQQFEAANDHPLAKVQTTSQFG